MSISTEEDASLETHALTEKNAESYIIDSDLIDDTHTDSPAHQQTNDKQEKPIENIFKKLKKPVTPIPWRPVLILICVTICEGLSSSFFFSFGALMSEYQFGIVEEQLGFYVGFLTTAYYAGQLVSNYGLGWVSDRIGRRPILLLGMLVNMACLAMFGLCRYMWVGIVFRFLNGLLNNTMVIGKCYVREITDETNQARVFSFRGIGYSTGAIIGPILGGIFAQPAADSFAVSVFGPKFFTTYPYVIPSWMVSFINLVCFTIAFFYLPETLPGKSTVKFAFQKLNQHEYEEDDDNVDDPSKLVEMATFSTPDCLDKSNTDSHNDNSNQNNNDNDDGTEMSAIVVENDNIDTKLLTSSENEENEKLDVIELTNESVKQHESDDVVIKEHEIELTPKQEDDQVIYHEKKSPIAFLNSAVLTCMLLYMMISYLTMTFQTTYPIWAVRSVEQHGLAFGDLQIGILNSIGAVAPLLFQLFFYAPIDKLIGTTRSFRTGLLIYIPCVLLLPLCSHIAHHPAILWVFIVFFIGGAAFSANWAFVAVNIMINNASSSDSLGKVNGIAATMSALFRIIAPITGPPLFEWSADGGNVFPFNYYLMFWLIGLASFICLCCSLAVPSFINRHRKSD